MAIWQLDPDVVHLNHGSFGACPVEVLDHQAVLRGEMEANPVAFLQRHYQPALEAARVALAEFVNADPAGLVFVPNATYGVNSALRSLEGRLAAGSEVVVTTHTYNACRNAVDAAASRSGASVVVVDIPFPITGPDRVVDAVLDAVSGRTALVVLDQVTSPTALHLPVAEIIDAIDPGVPVVVDGAHGPGMVDVDLQDLGAGFYTANCHKWLCAPKGAAFLWVADEFRADATPVSVSHGYNGGWPTSGSRFHAQFDWTGTDDPTARLCVPKALEVMADHHRDGWPGIRRSNRALVLEGRRLLADALSLDLPAPESMIGSMASLPLPAGPGGAEDLQRVLHAEWAVEVPVVPWPPPDGRAVRISAQQYNTVEHYRRLAEALAAQSTIAPPRRGPRRPR